MRKVLLVFLAGFMGLASLPVEAQTSRHHRYEGRRYERPAHRAVPRYQRAPAAVPSQGGFPVIHWNTPNQDGNFGGPGAGGGSVGG